MTTDPEKCALCNGDTIRFSGKGKDLARWLCPNWKDPGHLPEAEIRERQRAEIAAHIPFSGRFA